ncbi:MAG: hypothetical protein F6K19_50620 [Cyanothece sp. SIO1E1]|nr:hypothetical protein [Cyanothece sp. SIO1E1]
MNEAGQILFSSQSELRQNARRDEVFEIAIAPLSSTNPTPPEQPEIPLDGSIIWFETRSVTPRQDDRFDGKRLIKLAQQRVQRTPSLTG